MTSITTDITALMIQKALLSSSKGEAVNLERMTTGLKINHAKDNAAGFFATSTLSTYINSTYQILDNIEMGIDTLTTAEDNLENIQSMLNRLRELAMQAGNGTYDTLSRNAMQNEADAIKEEIQRIIQTAEYNGLKIFASEEVPAPGTFSLRNINNQTSNILNRLQNAAVVSDNEEATSYPQLSQTTTGVSNSLVDTSGFSLKQTTSNGISLMSTGGIMPLATTLEGGFDFTAGQTKTIDIDGVSYTVKNNLTSTSNTLSYIKDTTTGEVTLNGSNFTITGQSDVSHNINIIGSYVTFNGGELSDTINLRNPGNSYVTVNSKGGNDSISVIDGRNCTIDAGAGDDIINTKNSTTGTGIYITASGGTGNDTFNVEGGSNTDSFFGGDDNDIFNLISRGSAYLYGENGEDTFNIQGGTHWRIDGGSGTNSVTGNIASSFVANTPGANSYIYYFSGNQTQSLNINGKNYTIKNELTTANSLLVKIEDDGRIDFRSENFRIEGDKNTQHKVKISGGFITFVGGDLADDIYTNSANCTIGGGKGDDIIRCNSYCQIVGGEGNDTFTGNYTYSFISGNGGEDKLTIDNSITMALGYGYIDLGDGNDTITGTGQNINSLSINGGAGNNTITGLTYDSNNTLVNGFNSDNVEMVTINGNETKTLTLAGKTYTIKNRSSNNSTFLYRVDEATGKVEFAGGLLTITGENNVEHDITSYGWRNYIYGGNLGDTITTRDYRSSVYGNDGDDTINQKSIESDIYGGNGNDTINISSSGGGIIYGGNGNDTFVNNANSSFTNMRGQAGNDTYILNKQGNVNDISGDNVYEIYSSNNNVTGGSGKDSFYVYGDVNTIITGGEADYAYVEGNNNNIDGGTGTNSYVDNGTGNVFTNMNPDLNNGVLNFTYVGEVKTFTSNGNTYTVTNQNADGTAPATNTLKYTLNPNTEELILDGSNFTVDSDINSAQNILVKGDNNTINGSNQNDKLVVDTGTNNILNGLDGNDTLNAKTSDNAMNGGNGNDNITISKTTSKVITGGDGNDSINVSVNGVNIQTGEGDDTIKGTSSNSTITTGNGNNNISLTGSTNTINTGNEKNTIAVSGNTNTITGGDGNNSISVSGNNNNISDGDGSSTLNIYGNSNTITSGEGNDKFSLNGDSNNASSNGGDNSFNLKGNQNSATGGSGKDNITISGNNNTASGGDTNDIFTINSGNSNNIDGNAGDANYMYNYGTGTVHQNVIDMTPKGFEINLKVDTGYDSNSVISVSFDFALIGLDIDLTTTQGALDTIEQIDRMMQMASNAIAQIGASINRLESAYTFANTKLETLVKSRSTIQDADIAKESTEYIQNSIMKNAAYSLFSIHKDFRTDAVLGLLRGIR